MFGSSRNELRIETSHDLAVNEGTNELTIRLEFHSSTFFLVSCTCTELELGIQDRSLP